MAYHRTRLCERRGANALKGVGGDAECECGSQQAQMSFSWLREAKRELTRGKGKGSEKERFFWPLKAFLHPMLNTQGHFSGNSGPKCHQVN